MLFAQVSESFVCSLFFTVFILYAFLRFCTHCRL